MNPLRTDDPRHLKAVEVAARVLSAHHTMPGPNMRTDAADTVTAYLASLKEQGVVLIEAYAGDDTGR